MATRLVQRRRELVDVDEAAAIAIHEVEHVQQLLVGPAQLAGLRLRLRHLQHRLRHAPVELRLRELAVVVLVVAVEDGSQLQPQRRPCLAEQVPQAIHGGVAAKLAVVAKDELLVRGEGHDVVAAAVYVAAGSDVLQQEQLLRGVHARVVEVPVQDVLHLPVGDDAVVATQGVEALLVVAAPGARILGQRVPHVGPQLLGDGMHLLEALHDAQHRLLHEGQRQFALRVELHLRHDDAQLLLRQPRMRHALQRLQEGQQLHRAVLLQVLALLVDEASLVGGAPRCLVWHRRHEQVLQRDQLVGDLQVHRVQR